MEAALGAELEIPTIDGKVKYNLPAGTQTNTTFRLRGQGIPNLNGRGRGDQYVTVQVKVPKTLSDVQREALRRFDKAMKGEPLDTSEPNFGKGRASSKRRRKNKHFLCRVPFFGARHRLFSLKPPGSALESGPEYAILSRL